jgi:hypothetical protein
LAHLSPAAPKLRRLLSFHLLLNYVAKAPSSTFNPRLASFNLNPRRHFIPLQLQSSLPTSFFIAANFNPRRLQFLNPVVVLFPPLLVDDARGVLDAVVAK